MLSLAVSLLAWANDETPVGNYLGQEPPGLVPELAESLSPDGSILFFARGLRIFSFDTSFVEELKPGHLRQRSVGSCELSRSSILPY